MDKVFIVTEGEYSDYRIRAVFSSREYAEKYIEIEECDLDFPKSFLERGYNIFYIEMDKDGNTLKSDMNNKYIYRFYLR